jgi:hypothetical protein
MERQRCITVQQKKQQQPTKHHTTDAYVYKPIDYSHPKTKVGVAPSESISFMLPRDVLYKLRQEAKRKEISVNTLMTQIAKRHTDWYVAASQIGFVSVRKILIMKLLDEIRDDEKIKEIAKEVAKESNDLLLLLKKQYNTSIESALDLIESWIKESGYPYLHDTSGIDQNFHHFVIQHDMGLKWSLYLLEIYRDLFEELFNVTGVHFDMTDNTVEFTVDTGLEGGQ